MKNINIFGKSIPAFVIALIAISVLGSAALLTVYVSMSGTATVNQAVTFTDDNTSKTFSFESSDNSAGKTYVDMFTLTNNADVPATVKFETKYDKGADGSWTNDEDGITTKYYELAGFSGTIEESKGGLDLSEITYDVYGDVDYSVSYEGGKVVFTVDTPSGMIEDDGTDNIAFEFDNNADGTPDWQVKYQPDSGEFSGDYDWGYSENSGSNWIPGDGRWVLGNKFQDASNVVTVDRTSGTFKLKVDASKLGGFGSDYKYGFEIWNENLESASEEGVPQFVKIDLASPNGFSWSDMSSYPTWKIGTEITNPVTLEPGDTFDFAVVNDFNVALEPGDYTITSNVVPQ